MPVLKAREKLGAGVNEMCCVAIMKFDIERLRTANTVAAAAAASSVRSRIRRRRRRWAVLAAAAAAAAAEVSVAAVAAVENSAHTGSAQTGG